MERVRLNNGERLNGTGLTVLDQKGKPIAALGDGESVSYEASPGGETVAQIVQHPDNPLIVDITTEGDDPGVVTFTGKLVKANGAVLEDQLEVTVINSPAGSVRFSPGSVEPE